MTIIPAIDILDGKVVRLVQGDYGNVKVYSVDPVQTARDFKAAGSGYIHVVDLDGAKQGRPVNVGIAKKIVDSLGIEVELGGGLRTFDSIQKVLDAGIKKAVLGTAVLKDTAFAGECVKRFGDKVIFGIDVRDGTVRVDGWTKDSGRSLDDVIKFFESIGLVRIIYTDISRDGMMTGPNVSGLLDLLSKTKMEVVLSGGISKLDDIVRVMEIKKKNLKGIIVGKALYEGSIKLEEALRVS